MRPITQGSNNLHVPSSEICSVGPPILDLVKDMEMYLKKGNCVGLAAIQLGEPVRLIGFRFGNEIRFLVNPEVVKHSEQSYLSEEGCMSIGKDLYVVRRYKSVKVKGLTLDGTQLSYKGRDLFGAVLQHEIDHLNGVTIDQVGRKYD